MRRRVFVKVLDIVLVEVLVRILFTCLIRACLDTAADETHNTRYFAPCQYRRNDGGGGSLRRKERIATRGLRIHQDDTALPHRRPDNRGNIGA